MPNLFPATYYEETPLVELTGTGAPAEGFKESAAFDIFSGDFLRDGRNAILKNDGVTAWKMWCVKNIMTQRYACLAYNTDFGIDIAEAFSYSDKQMIESVLTREITEALEADPYGRTKSVTSVSFDWTFPDAVGVTVDVMGTDYTEARIQAAIKR